MTPAQAYGHPLFTTSPGPGGPTDAGGRAASCAWAATLPARPGCVDCTGQLPSPRPEHVVFLGGLPIDMRPFF